MLGNDEGYGWRSYIGTPSNEAAKLDNNTVDEDRRVVVPRILETLDLHRNEDDNDDDADNGTIILVVPTL